MSKPPPRDKAKGGGTGQKPGPSASGKLSKDAETGKKPDSGKRSSDAGRKPSEAGKKPSEAGRKPSEAGRKPSEAGKKPDGDPKAGKGDGRKPSEAGRKPEKGKTNPLSQGSKEPANSGRSVDRTSSSGSVQKKSSSRKVEDRKEHEDKRKGSERSDHKGTEREDKRGDRREGERKGSERNDKKSERDDKKKTEEDRRGSERDDKKSERDRKKGDDKKSEQDVRKSERDRKKGDDKSEQDVRKSERDRKKGDDKSEQDVCKSERDRKSEQDVRKSERDRKKSDDKREQDVRKSEHDKKIEHGDHKSEHDRKKSDKDDKKTSKKESERVKGDQSPQKMIEVVVEDQYKYSDEEFEDYEEDLESSEEEEKVDPLHVPKQEFKESADNSKEVLQLMQAMEAENKSVKQPEKKKELTSPEPEEKVSRPLSSRKFLNFKGARKKLVSTKVAKKAMKRGEELLSMIELDEVAFDMFDLEPLSEYEVYVKKFGSDDARQAAVQTGEDNMEAEAQTEPILSYNVWVQWPPEDFRGYGREGEGVDGSGSVKFGQKTKQSAVRLVSFLQKAGQVCSVLLEENLAASGMSQTHSTQSQFPFCTSCVKIQNVPSNLSGWYVNHVEFSPGLDHLILTSYTRPAVEQVPMGVVCVWNAITPTNPQMILRCQSPVISCCFSPQKTSLAFAGGEDGSVVLWDLREPSSMHHSSEGRAATFSTAGIPQLENHQAPVVSIKSVSVASPVPTSTPVSSSTHGESHDQVPTHQSASSTHSKKSTSFTSHGRNPFTFNDSQGDDGTGLSFQLASLDQSGLLKLWVVIELVFPEPHGSEFDLGLAPGGRVKLVKSASVDLASSPACVSIQVHCLQFHPQDTNHIFVGSNTACVLHHTRYGRRAIPHRYVPQKQGAAGYAVNQGQGSGDVTSIHFSLQQPDHFLIGCSDGSIRLHYTKRVPPLHCWKDSTQGEAVTSVQWAEHCPGLFLVLDAASNLYMWDILENDSEPVFKQQLKPRITACSLRSFPNQSPSELLLAFKDGSMELHSMKSLPHDSKLSGQREQKLVDYLNSLL